MLDVEVTGSVGRLPLDPEIEILGRGEGRCGDDVGRLVEFDRREGDSVIAGAGVSVGIVVAVGE